MLEVVTRVRNSSQRKTAISSSYKPGFSDRCSQRASIINGVTVRFRLIRVGGAFELGVRAHFQIAASLREYL